MRLTHMVLVLLAASVLAGGCAHKPGLVGTWVGPHVLPGGEGSVPSSITLRGDGTATGKAVAPADLSVPSSITLRGDGTFTTTAGTGSGASGTYSVDGNKLTETFSSYTVDGKVQAIPAHAAVSQSGTFRLDGDTLTLTIGEDSGPSVLTRRKGE